jgi:hypothetical protein
VGLLAIAIMAGYFAGRRYVDMQVDTWFAISAAGGEGQGVNRHHTLAGWWYFFVSLAIFRFLLLRWMFRVAVWYRFLWQVSRRVPLQLNALHPDQAGGLGFLANTAFAFQPLLLATSVGVAGIMGNKIWHEGARLPQFKLEILAWIAFLIVLVLAPLCCFMMKLAAAKRAGTREYGVVASRYVAEFRQKWIEGGAGAAGDEALIGSADIQSLADLSNSFAVARDMRLVPFGRATVLSIAVMTALPFAPLLFTVFPLDMLVDRALGVFL